MTSPPPDITAVSVVRHGVLRLTFADGLTGEVDVLARMWGPVFEEARTPEGFAKVTVDERPAPSFGLGTPTWPPDTLYERVRTGIWPDQNVAA